ncbi:MAG: hypothetical protein QNJ42_10330 [Crocosphaera sp.]|nr:hypothetical protein [Crocosphaera sp.]
MTNGLFATPELRQDAKKIKGEFLVRTFGATPQVAGVSQISGIPLDSNIVGVGYGLKVSENAILDDLALRVYVRSKLPKSQLSNHEQIPPEINGKLTDIIPVNDLSALVRPVECGTSVGHFNITAGTLGCLVKKSTGDDGEIFILSNNHILADSNEGKIGDNILEPGSLDGGTSPIAKLTDFETINLDDQPNFIDAAIAKVINNTDVKSSILTIGTVEQPTMPAAMYQSVRKHGRTTGHTVGVIMDLAADVRVRFGRKIANFEDQLAIQGVNGLFSQGGDSGSLIVDAITRRPVALLFAGGGNQTFACPIDQVLSRFNVDII